MSQLAPSNQPFNGSISLPGSKSITIRALGIAALADGRSHLYGALEADDTMAMANVLGGFGARVETGSEPWVVHGTGGSLDEPPEALDARESGLTARIAIALASLVDGQSTVDGIGRLRERPMRPLLDALASQGVSVESASGLLPVRVLGLGSLRGGEFSVDSTLSSQFVTALLVVSPMAGGATTLRVEGARGAAGYVDLTGRIMERFGGRVEQTITGYNVVNTGYKPADFQVEPDLSAAVYPMVAAAITGSTVNITGVGWGTSQPDIEIARCLVRMGCEVESTSKGLRVTGPRSLLDPIEVDLSIAPDGALALAIACLFADGQSRISGLNTLQYKESDRLRAMNDAFVALGATAATDGDSLVITPGGLHGTSLRSHGDHRVAMSLALVGLRVNGVRIDDPSVVSKTWPSFWDDMRRLTNP